MKRSMCLGMIIGLFSFCGCKGVDNSRVSDTPAITLDINQGLNAGCSFSVVFERGSEHNHPLMAIWAEDTNGNYLETFFVARSIGKGFFGKATGGGGKWLPGPARRPAALPYWAHKRGVKEADGLYIPTPETAMPDAIAGATPSGNFVLNAKPSSDSFPQVFDLLFELNQSWDWNEFWTNSMYLEDQEYRTSSQPSLVYRARVNGSAKGQILLLQPVGHGHYSGATGELFPDLTTMTTALAIAKRITVEIK